MTAPILVLDANILIRAVLGKKVRQQLITYSGIVDFLVPDICIDETTKYLPIIFEKRNINCDIPLEIFSHVKNLLQIIDKNLYEEYAKEAQLRTKNRDLQDWPIVATALLFNCPIWTEDKDFFGVGLPVWTSDRIHLYFDEFKNRNAELINKEVEII
jgi:predicted nucleic acid-binding protein